MTTNCLRSCCVLVSIIIVFFIEIWILELSWNVFIPNIFKYPKINFVQAICLYILSHALICPKYNLPDNIKTYYSNITVNNNQNQVNSEI